ncbi:hypothetical protein PpBr36_04965 [Pyricularia pennisetigena]|uniref:hypothetical protein n=1 Tax=Pyricularia pennisetigena TaxID=1578925 RepID=UPI0011520C54|nr:hypothetical protein PpBr36_04965 [Pyricularia pennisetigena]TLS27122.1 hypothetical protein PpBr36_04965 [Pyricularia pennisetigena]
MAVKSLESALDTSGLADEQRDLIDLIAKLQFAQLDNVKLPQIVVVGDQSAGKSSVLEAITGTPFPRDSGACTRFATEIRLRRAPERSLKVTIIPDKTRPYRDQEALLRFGGTVDANTPFDTLMRLAVELIAPKNIPGRFAARDILVVEKMGPEMPLLTLVDLPGLVRNANNDQSLEDIRTIEALSDRYMKSSRTIILAVVGGNSDYVQAPILTKVRQFDPNGNRTLGVLTKPDLTESIGLEDKFIDLVSNKDGRNHFKLGWYCVLNAGPREAGQPWPSAQERREREQAFFTRGKWAAIPEQMRGVDALKRKLSEQLQRHIGRHLGGLRRQIQTALDNCESELRQLGEGKDTPEEMKIELVELFSSSKELVIPALLGFYKNPPKKTFFRSTADPNGTPASNLRARAIEENERFSNRVRSQGRKFSFAANSNHQANNSNTDPNNSNPHNPPDSAAKRAFVEREVQPLLRQIRGSEFPMDPKPRAVYMLYQNFSENWSRLAQEHKDNLSVVCSEFIAELLDYAWPRRMRQPLMRAFVEPQMRALMDKAQAELELLTQDMHLEIQPYDPEYEERLRKWHSDVAARDESGRATYTEAEEVLEKMLIYYELSAKTFIRNVITQVVERHLLGGMYTLFNAIEVLNMDNETVEAIAAENRETRDRRQTLKQQKKAIEEAKSLCSSLAMRKELRVYAEEEMDMGGDSSDEEDGTQNVRTPTTPRAPAMESSGNYNNAQHASPESSKQKQRSSRQEQYVPARQEASTATPTSYTNAHRPVSQQQVRPSEPSAEEYHVATSRNPPSQAPPPPPRPDKIRSATDNDADSSGYYRGSTNGYTNGGTDAHPSPMVSETSSDYMQQGAARRNNPMRKILGRG